MALATAWALVLVACGGGSTTTSVGDGAVGGMIAWQQTGYPLSSTEGP